MHTISRSRRFRAWLVPFLALVLCCPFAMDGAKAAEIEPTSDVLLPYFEVDLADPAQGLTTLFAVGNVSPQAAAAEITLYTNWGIALFRSPLALGPDEVRSFNLRDWIVRGDLPDRDLGPDELAHVQAALTGRPSPRDGLYYGTPDEEVPDLAIGYVTVRTTGGRPDVLWGDYYEVDGHRGFFQAETLVNIDPQHGCQPSACTRHAVRFLNAGPLTHGTQLLIWTGRNWAPSSTPQPGLGIKVATDMSVFDEPGRHVEDRALGLLPVEIVEVEHLSLQPSFGWLDILTEEPAFIGEHLHTTFSPSASLHAYCVPEESRVPGPAIDLQKFVNGEDADQPPGPSIAVGSAVTWEFRVHNTGTVPLTGVAVTDSRAGAVSCPQDTLEPDERMTCTLSGFAEACQQSNLGTVAGFAPDGTEATDEDPAHYFGEPAAGIDVEKRVNGEDADTPPGPVLQVGQEISWTYIVTNTGDIDLAAVTVTDSQGLTVTCPGSQLKAGASMTCTASSFAKPGAHQNVATATGLPPCGTGVTDSDPANYMAPDGPDIDLEKYIDGNDADVPPGPGILVGKMIAWLYVVTNVGMVQLTQVSVSDDQGLTVFCPKTVLEPGEAMTCVAESLAVKGPHRNVATASGVPPAGPPVTDSDPAHYVGLAPRIDLEKYVNGEDADEPPGPRFLVGTDLYWTFLVTNTGDVTLYAIQVTDDDGLTVACPKAELAPGEMMVCTASSKAILGSWTDVGTAYGTAAGDDDPVFDEDPCHYHGEQLGEQGCSPGYWKNHAGSWPPTGLSPDQPVDSVFAGVNAYYPGLGNATLLEALSFGGGSGGEGAARILLRSGVAALLNASHAQVHYPRPAQGVVADVNAALLLGREAMLSLAGQLDADNNLGCPLN